MYATIQQARNAGAVGSDAQITAELHAARQLIDRFTSDVHALTQLTVVARIGADGSAFLPYMVRDVMSVKPVGGIELPVSGYRVLSSRTPGQIDAVLLGGRGAHDILVKGAEPWAGGWAGLARSTTGQVEVTGTFGPDETPTVIRDAAAALAAARTQGQTTIARPVPVTPDVDDEGNAVSITVDAEHVARRIPTTGLDSVDAALTPYVRGAVRIN